MRREVAKRLWDAYAACGKIADFTRTVDFDAFASSVLLRSAVERQFEIIGEALRQGLAADDALRRSIPA